MPLVLWLDLHHWVLFGLKDMGRRCEIKLAMEAHTPPAGLFTL